MSVAYPLFGRTEACLGVKILGITVAQLPCLPVLPENLIIVQDKQHTRGMLVPSRDVPRLLPAPRSS